MEEPTYILEFEKPLQALEKQLTTLLALSQESKVDVSNEIEGIEKKNRIDQGGHLLGPHTLATSTIIQTPQTSLFAGLHRCYF